MLYTCNHFRVLKVLIQENKLDLFGSATVARLLSGIFKTNNQSQRELVLMAALTLIPHTLTSTRTHKCFEWDTSSACFYFVLNLIYSNACGIILFVTQLRESKTVCEWVWMNTMWPRFCLDVSVYLHSTRELVFGDVRLIFLCCIYFSFRCDENKQQSVHLFSNICVGYSPDLCFLPLICGVNTHLYSSRTQKRSSSSSFKFHWVRSEIIFL